MITDIKNVAMNPNRAMDNVTRSRTAMGSFFRNYVKKVETAACCGIIFASAIGLVELLILGNSGSDRGDNDGNRNNRRNGQR